MRLLSSIVLNYIITHECVVQECVDLEVKFRIQDSVAFRKCDQECVL